uniref:Uncharacterized protein n=1 Tax=Chromera velia CCMP2878 TaxID=1169474 RepID=A0A0G4I206_9ALVE|eukprot:Cvel_10248.t1-p1 / transcript=Cvel_10248.t1 / gene=Cvel_10248 / organism=Chromera_velia_CCMP2878 / gene_product=hypothetical protein / transcript_product=hypothetical protein / location=Cvel_scaffold614:31124-33022(-) / protein_length=575 / sequence_SO=supercontig / SO=protein_coding / is_pseudo=false
MEYLFSPLKLFTRCVHFCQRRKGKSYKDRHENFEIDGLLTDIEDIEGQSSAMPLSNDDINAYMRGHRNSDTGSNGSSPLPGNAKGSPSAKVARFPPPVVHHKRAGSPPRTAPASSPTSRPDTASSTAFMPTSAEEQSMPIPTIPPPGAGVQIFSMDSAEEEVPASTFHEDEAPQEGPGMGTQLEGPGSFGIEDPKPSPEEEHAAEAGLDDFYTSEQQGFSEVRELSECLSLSPTATPDRTAARRERGGVCDEETEESAPPSRDLSAVVGESDPSGVNAPMMWGGDVQTPSPFDNQRGGIALEETGGEGVGVPDGRYLQGPPEDVVRAQPQEEFREDPHMASSEISHQHTKIQGPFMDEKTGGVPMGFQDGDGDDFGGDLDDLRGDVDQPESLSLKQPQDETAGSFPSNSLTTGGSVGMNTSMCEPNGIARASAAAAFLHYTGESGDGGDSTGDGASGGGSSGEGNSSCALGVQMGVESLVRAESDDLTNDLASVIERGGGLHLRGEGGLIADALSAPPCPLVEDEGEEEGGGFESLLGQHQQQQKGAVGGVGSALGVPPTTTGGFDESLDSFFDS